MILYLFNVTLIGFFVTANYRHLFASMFSHNGNFFPKYVNGEVRYIDCVQIEKISISHMNEMTLEIGYNSLLPI